MDPRLTYTYEILNYIMTQERVPYNQVREYFREKHKTGVTRRVNTLRNENLIFLDSGKKYSITVSGQRFIELYEQEMNPKNCKIIPK